MTTPTETLETDMNDSEAPYGRTLDGRPKKRPGGRPPKNKAARAGSRPGGATPPPSRPKTAARRKSSSSKPDYSTPLTALLGVIALPLRFVSPLDAVTVQVHAGTVAEAINETAKDRPEIAALCDRLLQVGPYSLIIGAILPMGAQIAQNHGWLPPAVAQKLGAIPEDVLISHATEFAAQQEAQQAAQQAAQEAPPEAETAAA